MRHNLRRLLGFAAAVMLVGLWSAAPASAHDELIGTDPSDGAAVAVAPDHVTLTFVEPPLQVGTELLVTGPDGAQVQSGAAVVAGSQVVQALGADRPAGSYRVAWRVTSDDGHVVSGTFGFTAQAAVGGTDRPSSTAAVTGGATAPTTTAASPPGSATGVTSTPGGGTGTGTGPRSAVPVVLAWGAVVVLVVLIGAVMLRRQRRGPGAAPGSGDD